MAPTYAVFAVAALALVASAASAQIGQGQAAPVCPAGGRPMVSVTLFFGSAIPGGGRVSDRQFRAFLDRTVTPRFPEGLSVFAVTGQWRDARTRKLVREPSRALQIWHPPSEAANRSVEAIREAYKARFRQDSVMRVDDLDCVSF